MNLVWRWPLTKLDGRKDSRSQCQNFGIMVLFMPRLLLMLWYDMERNITIQCSCQMGYGKESYDNKLLGNPGNVQACNICNNAKYSYLIWYDSIDLGKLPTVFARELKVFNNIKLSHHRIFMSPHLYLPLQTETFIHR